MLTAAVRDLHRGFPGQFITDVRTLCPPIWQHNPHITPIADDDPDAERIECKYPLIDRCNRVPYHCLHGFMQFLSERLGVPIVPTEFAGDIHLSPEERRWMSQVHELTERDIPFWIIVAGGKFDVTIKWWSAQRWQEVVDHFRGRIQFVQVGQPGHFHPALSGVIDLRGKTSLRQLIRLVYHAQGVLSPVTCLMHLAAAIEAKPGLPKHRPCVVVAGGREPTHWEAYPHHQFIHSIGALACCSRGGCWKARSHPLGDGDPGDTNLCTDMAADLPRCMQMIEPHDVIRRIELYFEGGAVRYLTGAEQAAAAKGICKTAPTNPDKLTVFTARAESERFIRTVGKTDHAWSGRGIVIPAGGATYLACAWVCINMLRRSGCTLPIELWHLGPAEMDDGFIELVAPLNVRAIDAHSVRERHPARRLNGWELKAYALYHCRFAEVLLLDADNVPVANPEPLFNSPEFERTGALFWPDRGRLARERAIWRLCGVPFRDEPEFESGQVVADKARCWQALRLALWYNEHSDFFYQYIHGDKDTFHLAFRKLNLPYAMPDTPLESVDGVMCQHDFAGRRIFQHRSSDKWRLGGPHKRIAGLLFEEECLACLDALQRQWSARDRVADELKLAAGLP